MGFFVCLFCLIFSTETLIYFVWIPTLSVGLKVISVLRCTRWCRVRATAVSTYGSLSPGASGGSATLIWRRTVGKVSRPEKSGILPLLIIGFFSILFNAHASHTESVGAEMFTEKYFSKFNSWSLITFIHTFISVAGGQKYINMCKHVQVSCFSWWPKWHLADRCR